MKSNDYKKHKVNQIAGVIKFCFAIGVLATMYILAPDHASQLLPIVGAFIVGKSRIGSLLA
jgi:hypothetical protein